MVTSQQAKEWLNRNYGMWKQLKSLKHRRASQTFANISNYEQEFSEVTGNATEEKMADFAELNRKIEALEQKLAAGDSETMAVIDKVETPVYWSVLRDRYIERKGWRQIAKSYCYSERHVYREHGRALNEVRKFIPEEEL